MEDADVAWGVGEHITHPTVDETLSVSTDGRDDGALVFIGSTGGDTS